MVWRPEDPLMNRTCTGAGASPVPVAYLTNQERGAREAGGAALGSGGELTLPRLRREFPP